MPSVRVVPVLNPGEDRQVQKILPRGWHIRHVSKPQFIDVFGNEAAFEQIGRRGPALVSLGGHAPGVPAAHALEVHRAHEASDAIAPVVIPAGADLERFTRGAHGVVRLGLLSRAGRRCKRPLAFAYKPGAQAFANMSLSIWSWRNLRRSSTSSWRSATLSGPCGTSLLASGAAACVPIGLSRTHLASVVACRPNSLATLLAMHCAQRAPIQWVAGDTPARTPLGICPSRTLYL